jgi:hypothetical protein
LLFFTIEHEVAFSLYRQYIRHKPFYILMRKFFLLLVATLFVYSASAKEGMWIPYLLKQLNEAEMRDMGLQISAEDIYSVNNSSLKDAIVHFGGGCTAELIGSKGLLLTNHHCGYSRIQSHSSVENDYLKNGFWAMNESEEKTNPGLTASIVKYMRDVTNEAMEGIAANASAEDRSNRINKNLRKLVDAEREKTGYMIEVVPFFYGNQYILFAKEVFKDVRLVGAPPSSIGKYGADTDNWVWPRHTGDFSLFRVYANKENKPAEISDENRPYNPIQFLTINTNGFQNGDFTMVYGFPGRTQEYLPAVEVQNIIEHIDPLRIGVRQKILETLDRKMRKDDATRIKYASKYASIANGWKKWIGEVDGLVETEAVKRKLILETEFAQKINSDESWKLAYGNTLTDLNKAYKERLPLALARYNFIERVYYGSEFLRYMMRFKSLVDAVDAQDTSLIDKLSEQYAQSLERFGGNLDVALDKEVFTLLFPDYLNALESEGKMPTILKELKNMSEEEQREFAMEAYEKALLLKDKDALRELLANKPQKAVKKLKKDKAYQLATAMRADFDAVNLKMNSINKEIEVLQGTYMRGLQDVFPSKRFYPDANSTLRVAYGKIEPYDPVDGIEYKTQTYLKGVMAKYVPGDYEFDLPQKLIDLYQDKDYGNYGEEGKMPVCFIASNHTTGGNSGSPALNGKGELVGLNFDRAWEGTMSDINYDFSRCRNIMVDIRYVLFITDKFAGAGYLLDEMRFAEAEEAEVDLEPAMQEEG